MKIKRNPARAPEFKRSYFQFFGSTEVFLEAIPTVLVQTVIMNEKSTILAQGGLGSTFFYVTFLVSVLSASFGLAKTLKLGICSIMGYGGQLDGLLTCKFLMLLFSCGFVLVLKGFIISKITNLINFPLAIYKEMAIGLVLGLFLPQFLLAIWSSGGATKSSLKMISQHPSIILLPMFTFFTFAKMDTSCCGKRDVRVRFSYFFTCLNMVWSLVSILSIFISFDFLPRFDASDFVLFVSIFLPSFIFNIIYLFYDSCCGCCYECCQLPTTQLSVYDPDNPHLELVLRNGEVEEFTEYADIREESVREETEGHRMDTFDYGF